MQTKFCRQTLSRHVPPECRQRLSKMQMRALNFSRKCRQNYADKLCLESGRGRLHSCSSTQRCRGCLQRKCRQGLSTVFGGFFADKVCLQSLSTGLVCTIWECRQSLSTGLKSLSKAFCKVVCGNADKVCLEITSFSLFSDLIIVSSHRVRWLSLESSHQFESSCCLARTDLHSRKCVFVCARGIQDMHPCHSCLACVRACVRACGPVCERASEQRAASERAASSERASSEQRAAASVHSSFVIHAS